MAGQVSGEIGVLTGALELVGELARREVQRAQDVRQVLLETAADVVQRSVESLEVALTSALQVPEGGRRQPRLSWEPRYAYPGTLAQAPKASSPM
ncbi:hypothetical protein D7Y21_10480 [Corallococcus sp. AB045]|nr:hypothetical protein D7Y21_10480 [Corallococcus sp. AB045]